MVNFIKSNRVAVMAFAIIALGLFLIFRSRENESSQQAAPAGVLGGRDRGSDRASVGRVDESSRPTADDAGRERQLNAVP